jgi:hypothetical protein
MISQFLLGKNEDIKMLHEICSDFLYWQLSHPSMPMHQFFNYYNVVLFIKFLTMTSTSCRNIEKFLIKHLLLPGSATLIVLSFYD